MNNNMKRVSETKMVAVSDLPDGYFKERLTELARDTSVIVYVVAKAGSIGDWAAYIGFPEIEDMKDQYKDDYHYYYYCTNVHHPQGVLDHGDKLDRSMAIQLFPNWKDMRYRG